MRAWTLLLLLSTMRAATLAFLLFAPRLALPDLRLARRDLRLPRLRRELPLPELPLTIRAVAFEDLPLDLDELPRLLLVVPVLVVPLAMRDCTLFVERLPLRRIRAASTWSMSSSSSSRHTQIR